MRVIGSKSDEYRLHAEECWELAYQADDIGTKAVFELTAQAWTKLAEQVERLESYEYS